MPSDALTPQTVTVTAVDDSAAEGDHLSTITHSASSSDVNYDGISVSDVTANVTDNDNAVVAVQIIDNGDSGFSTVGRWRPVSGRGYQNDVHFSAPGRGADVATWTFDVTPGVYRVSATWPAHRSRPTNAPFTVAYNGGAEVTTTINQGLAPNDLTDAGVRWEDLASSIRVTSRGTVVVTVNDRGNRVMADAARIERLGPLQASEPAMTSTTGQQPSSARIEQVFGTAVGQLSTNNPARALMDSPARSFQPDPAAADRLFASFARIARDRDYRYLPDRGHLHVSDSDELAANNPQAHESRLVDRLLRDDERLGELVGRHAASRDREMADAFFAELLVDTEPS